MQTLRGILIKTCSKIMQRIYTRGALQKGSLINSMHAPFTTPLIALLCFHLPNCKRLLQIAWILNDTLLHMQPEVLTMEHLKCLKKVLKSLNQKFWKTQVSEDETKLYSKKFLIPIAYLKSCLMSVLTHFELRAF